MLRALSPLSLDCGFRQIHLLSHSGDDYPYHSDDNSIHELCLSLSRSASRTSSMASSFLVAFPESHTSVSVVFPAVRKTEMKLTLQHCSTFFPEIPLDQTVDDEFGPGLALQNALSCGLAIALVRDAWTIFEGNLAVRGSITQWLDGTPTEAVTFAVYTESNDCISFLLSPDVFRCWPFEIGKFLIGPMQRLFDDGVEVVFDNYLENMTPYDIQELKCIVIPSMQEGLVSGCCKFVPKGFNLSKHTKIWSEKHGLILPQEVFYIQVSFSCKGTMVGSWFPSCLVLKRCGLVPALPNIRKAKIYSILEKITSSISGWNFFDAGKLKIEPNLQSAKESQSLCWTTANWKLQNLRNGQDGSNDNSKLCSGFPSLEAEVLQSMRRPKLPPSHHTTTESIEPPINWMNNLALSGEWHSRNPVKATIPSSLRTPIFLKRRSKDFQISCPGMTVDEINSEKENFKTELRKILRKKLPEESHILSAGNKSGALSFLKRKKVCTEAAKSSTKKLQDAAFKSTAAGEVSEGTSLLKAKGSRCSQPSIQKSQMAIMAPQSASNLVVETNSFIKQHTQDKSLLVDGSNEIKTLLIVKDQNVQKLTTSGDKKVARGDKKNASTAVDAVANRKKVLSKHAEGKLSDLTVPELKCFLSENKVKVSGKKEHLIQRVGQLLQRPMNHLWEVF